LIGWAKIRKAAEYAGVSERTLRDWLKKGLRHSCLPSGTVLIKYAAIDEYLDGFEVKRDLVDEIADSMASDLLAKNNRKQLSGGKL
jgi:excisionase family DNA binding protein